MNTYLFVLGIRVSGYIQYSGVRLLEGTSVDNAFNRKYLDDYPVSGGDWVVMEVHEIEETSLEEFLDTGMELGIRRII